MKHKKLFALLTLICFLFTLVPVAAFAADYEEDQVYISTESGHYQENADVMIYDTFEVFIGTASGSVTSSGYSFLIVDEDGNGVDVSNSNSFEIDEPGNYKVYALKHSWGSENQITNYINTIALKSKIVEVLMDVFEDELDTIGYASLEVEAAEDYEIALYGENGSELGSGTGNYEYALTIEANNGFNAETITAKVTFNDNDDETHNVNGAELKFRTNSNYITIEQLDEATNRRGQAEFQIHAAKDGEYKVTVSYEDASVDIKVIVNTLEAEAIKTVTVPKNPAALGTTVDGYSGIEFELRDMNGALTESATTPKVEVVSAPEGSDLEGETLYLESNGGGIWILSDDGTAPLKGQSRNTSITFDEEGEYTFRAYLKSGASATASMTVKEFGEPVSMKLSLNSKNVTPGFGDVSGKDIIKKTELTDANGVAKSISDAGYNVAYAVNGIAVKNFDSTTEKLTVKTTDELDEEKLIGSTITVIAICEELGMTATADIKVVAEAMELKYASKEAQLAINNTIKINTVNEKGSSVTVSNLSEAKTIVLSAPENAVYAADTAVNKSKGTITLTFTASVAGEYTVQTIATTNDHRYLSGTETITVGAEEGAFKDVIVLSIGTNQLIKNGELMDIPVAARIDNSRTVVPFSATLAAFGATIDWDGDARIASAELNGIKVAMTIDSTTYTINGVEHTTDTAPYIVDDRTMVPLVFFTDAFAITPTVIYAEDGTVSNVLFAK